MGGGYHSGGEGGGKLFADFEGEGVDKMIREVECQGDLRRGEGRARTRGKWVERKPGGEGEGMKKERVLEERGEEKEDQKMLEMVEEVEEGQQEVVG